MTHLDMKDINKEQFFWKKWVNFTLLHFRDF